MNVLSFSWNRKAVAVSLLLAAALISAFLAMPELWLAAGWPENHESNSMAVRMVQYAEELRKGNLFPIWCPAENYGLGSPLALFYPRVFSFVGALFYLAGVSIKGAIVSALVLIGAFGILGCYQMIRALRVPAGIALLLSLAFPHLNYAYTDIIVRGATAEYTGMCFLPWVLAWGFLLLRDGRFRYWIVAVEVGLFYAHTSIAIFAAPLELAFFVGALVRFPETRAKQLNAAVRAFAAVFLLTGPYALLLLFERDFYLFEIGYLHMICPKYFFPSPWHMLFPGGLKSVAIDCRLDFSFLAGIIVAVFFFGGAMRRNRAAVHRAVSRCWWWGIWLGGMVVYFFFLFRISWPLYQRCALLGSLQFSWRLLTYITVLEIAGAGIGAMMLRGIVRRKWLMLAAGLILAGSIGWNWLRPPVEKRISPEDFRLAKTGNWNEYMPLAPSFGMEKLHLSAYDLVGKYCGRVAEWLREWKKQPLQIKGTPPAEWSASQLPDGSGWEIRFRSEAGFVAVFPVLWDNFYVALWNDGRQIQKLSHWRETENPCLQVAFPAGEGSVRIFTPRLSNFWRMLRYPSGTSAPLSADL